MKAAVLIDAHNMVIDDVPMPVTGEGEVLLKVDSCGICGTDMEFYENGAYNPRWTLGHECSGMIVEVGSGVKGWKAGERVTVNDLFACGECGFCRRGLGNLCDRAANLGIHWPGAFAEFTKVPARSLFRLPEGVSMEEGALIPTIVVGYHVFRQAAARPDTKTLIIGAGPVGLSVLVALKIAGVRNVVVSDMNPTGKKAAASLGALAVIDPVAEDISERLESLFSSAPDLVFECAGKPATILQSMETVNRGGTVVMVGNCFEEISLIPITWIIKEINIKASQGTTNEDFETVLEWVAEKKLDAAVFITRTISLDELPETMAGLTHGKNDTKIIVKT